MNLQLLLIGVAVLLAQALFALRPLAPAHVVARASLFAYRTGLAFIVLGLFLTSLPTFVHASGFQQIGSICERVFVHTWLAGDVVGMAAGIVLLGLLVRTVGRVVVIQRRHRNVHVEMGVGRHIAHGSVDVVLLPVEDPFAYSNRRQVVLSEGLLRRLDRQGRRVVVRHELAHIELNHHRHVVWIDVARAMFGWIPWLREGLATWCDALERWSDDSVRSSGLDVDTIERTMLAVATAHPSPGLGFATADSVLLRRASLEAGASGGRLVESGFLWIVAAALPTAGTVLLGNWAFHTHAVVTGLPLCPI